MNRVLLIITCLLGCFAAKAQISTGGTPISITESFAEPPILIMDSVDNQSLIDSEFPTDDSITERFFFAKNLAIEKNISDIGEWRTSSNGHEVWRLSIQSSSAFYISVIINNFYLPKGGLLYFYDQNNKQINGAYTSLDNADDSLFISPFIRGNTITIEYVHPINGEELPNFNLRDIIHAYKQLPLFTGGEEWNTFGSSLDCHNNVVCEPFNDYCNEIRSVCLIMTSWTHSWTNCNGTNIETRWKGGSGALINNSLDDFTPYIFTARHVIWDQLVYHWCLANYHTTNGFTNLAETMFYFNYQSRDCDPTLDVASNIVQFVRGASVVESIAGHPTGPDLALLRLRINPPIQFNTFYSGWNRQGKDDLPSWAVTGIHHPRLDVKKISKGNLHYSTAYPFFWGVDWYSGVTEEGSSGSPLFNDGDRRIIGALSFGANDDCNDHNEQDRYGRLRDFWNRVNDELSPDDHGRETYHGADPATFCQDIIDINGQVFATAAYHSQRPSMTIQASSYVNIANLAVTRLEHAAGFRPKFDIKAGRAINVTPNNTFFETENNSVLILEIQGCESTTGCETDFNTQMRPASLKEDIIPIANNIEAISDIEIYPNPAFEKLFVRNIKNTQDFTISDITGKVLLHGRVKENESVNISNLSSGLYFIKVGHETVKFIKK